ARARPLRNRARAGGDRARPAAARHLPRHAAHQRRLWRHADPAPAGPVRARRAPARRRHLRRLRPRGQPGPRLPGAGCGRTAGAHDEVPPSPGRRPPGCGARGLRHLRLRGRACGGDRGAGQALRARRAVAPGGRSRELGDRGARDGGGALGARDRPRVASRRVRLSKAMRATAWGMVAAGLAAPLLRKRVSAPPVAMQAVSFAAPLGAAIAMRRSPRRDIAVCALQMWAYLAAYKTPHDDEEAQRARVKVAYPIRADRVIGLGELPSTRLQHLLARNGPAGPEWRALDRVLVWAHWSWF